MEGGGRNRVCRCWEFLQIKLHIKRKGINLVDSLFYEFLTSFSAYRNLYLHTVGLFCFQRKGKYSINDSSHQILSRGS